METERKVIVNGSEIIRIISVKDIVYCVAEGNYCQIFTNEGESTLWCKRIGDVLKELNDRRFIKVSQSILLNRTYIGQVNKKSKEVGLVFSEKKLFPYTIPLKQLLERIEEN